MYEYSIEVMEVTSGFFKPASNSKQINGLLEVINKKAEEGWELVANTHVGGDSAITAQSFVCTFKREKNK